MQAVNLLDYRTASAQGHIHTVAGVGNCVVHRFVGDIVRLIRRFVSRSGVKRFTSFDTRGIIGFSEWTDSDRLRGLFRVRWQSTGRFRRMWARKPFRNSRLAGLP